MRLEKLWFATASKSFTLWGKAEIEDMLFRPQNDHLLFAYFDISLQVKRRSQRARVRSLLAQKREAIRKLGDMKSPTTDPILIRDVNDERYFERDEVSQLNINCRYWQLYLHHPEGLVFILHKHFAYYDADSKEWDFIPDYDHALPSQHRYEISKTETENRYRYSYCWPFWDTKAPQAHRAWYLETALIPFRRILAIDEVGDVWNEGPHVIVKLDSNGKIFNENIVKIIKPTDNYSGPDIINDGYSRIKFFPTPIPIILGDDKKQS